MTLRRAFFHWRLALACAFLLGCSDDAGDPMVAAPADASGDGVTALCAGRITDVLPPPSYDGGELFSDAAEGSTDATPEARSSDLDGPANDDAAPFDAGVDAPDAAAMDAALPIDAGAPDAAPTARRVIFISIDGLRPDAITKAPAPNLITLACLGSYSWSAHNVTPTLTIPNHASMVSGFPPSAHMLFHNDLRPGYLAVPTVMGVVRNAGRKVVIVVGKEKLIQLAPPDSFDVFVVAPDGDDDVADKAIAEVQSGFDLMFVHFPNVDLVGHAQGWMSDAYIEQVSNTDLALGRLLRALPADTTIIVSADHGGSGYIHWSGVPEDSRVPWVIKGPGVRVGHPIAQPISTMDTAATVAHLFGLSLRGDAEGRPVTEPLMAAAPGPSPPFKAPALPRAPQPHESRRF